MNTKVQKRPPPEQHVMRQGEGTHIEVVPHSHVLTDGRTVSTFEINLSAAPVPDRRYVADVACVSYSNHVLKFMFGQQKITSNALRSLLVIHMSSKAAKQFLVSLNGSGPLAESTIEGESLYSIDEEPEQTVSFASNMTAIAVSNREACIDFYQASPFSMNSAPVLKKLGVESVVRVDLRTSLLVGLVKQVRQIEKEFPSDEEGGGQNAGF